MSLSEFFYKWEVTSVPFKLSRGFPKVWFEERGSIPSTQAQQLGAGLTESCCLEYKLDSTISFTGQFLTNVHDSSLFLNLESDGILVTL